MATYKNPVEIKGTIGDLVYYTLNGKPVVRRKSGFNSDAFKNNPNYANVKKNSSEFGHCSKSGKLIRNAIETFLVNFQEKYLYQRFTKLMTNIKDLDTKNEKGNRRIENGLKKEAAQKLLQKFQFGELPLSSEVLVSGGAFFTKAVSLKGKSEADTIQFITLNPDLKDLKILVQQQSFPVSAKKTSFDFDLHFQDSASPLLYFALLKKGNELISAGFIE